MRLSIIVAVSQNGVIGREGDLPWRLSADLQRFKRLTMGHPILMGRKTYESIGRPLPGRTSIVLTRQRNYAAAPGVLVASTLDEALQLCGEAEQAFIIGGEQLYQMALPMAERVYLTRVDADVAGDARFPQLDPGDWVEIESEQFDVDAKNDFPTTFKVLERRGGQANSAAVDAQSINTSSQ